MGFDDLLSADRIEKELLAEFSPIAFALTPADGFDEIALANGYVKLADDEMIVKQLKTGEVCFGSVNVDQIARKFRYIRLQPGQLVVNEDLCDYCAANEYNKAINYIRLQPGQVVVDGKAIVDYCGACDDESMTVVCDGCVIKPIRDRISEVKP
jgi:hypothetical protein